MGLTGIAYCLGVRHAVNFRLLCCYLDRNLDDFSRKRMSEERKIVMIIALKKSKFLSNFVKHVDWLIGEQVTSCLGETYKINNVDVFDSDLVKILVVRLYKHMNDVRNNIIEIEDYIKTDRDLKIMKEMLKAFDYIMKNDQPANN